MRYLALLVLGACAHDEPPSMTVQTSTAKDVDAQCMASAAAVGDSDVGCLRADGGTSYTFVVRAAADATLEAACERFVARTNDCSDSPLDVEDPCPVWAKVERPELAKVYACYATSTCDRLESCDAPAPTTVGTELCAALEKLAGTDVCGDELRVDLNMETAWLRPDVIAAGRECLDAATSAELEACLNEWMLAAKL